MKPTALRRGRGGFQEIDLTLYRCEGTFEQFVRFLALLEGHETFVRVNSLHLEPARDGRVSAALNISTLRFDDGTW